jgi:hypothetical protein
MTSGGWNTASLRLLAIALLAVLLAACAGGPQSQATEASEAPTATPASDVPPSTEPASAEPGSEAPSEAATPDASADASPLAIPPKPSKVTWKELSSRPLAGGLTRESYRISWTAPDGAAATFKVYGVTTCLRDEKRFDGKPCVVKGMKIPKGTLKLLAQVPGSARSVDIAWKVGEIGPGPYAAVLVRASNDAGNSTFAIAWSAAVCWQCTY